MIGYLTFRNPSGMIAIIDGLEEWCAKRGFARVADLTGAMIHDKAGRDVCGGSGADWVTPVPMTTRITIRKPDDWHLHVRDGAMLKAVLPYTAKHFGRAILMPNLDPAGAPPPRTRSPIASA